MTPLTVVTDPAGKLVAAVQGSELRVTKDGYTAEVSFDGTHRIQKIQVEDSVLKITDANAFHDVVLRHLGKQ